MPVEDLEEELFDLLAAIGIGLAVSTVLLVGLSYVLAGRIVKPIAAINRLARDINENTLEKRIPLGKSHDEIHDLASRLNECSTVSSFPLPGRSVSLATPPMNSRALSPCCGSSLTRRQRGDLPEAFVGS